MKYSPNLEKIIRNIRSGDRVALGKAITLIESRKDKDQEIADQIVNQLDTKNNTLRIGITGIPGAGKSTFIESLGQFLLKKNHRLAVLSIDPSSASTKGSILGDKTRMPFLAANEQAFIRPTPAGSRLGGVANRTKETVLLCEAAGFDIILIETIGVGQGEIEITNLVDLCLVLTIPGGGDELQGIKRGIMEIADILVINKADMENEKQANKIAGQLKQALQLLPLNDPEWKVPVLTCSSIHHRGIQEIWDQILNYQSTMNVGDKFTRKRHLQNLIWFRQRLMEKIEKQYFSDDETWFKIEKLEEEVRMGSLTVLEAISKV